MQYLIKKFQKNINSHNYIPALNLVDCHKNGIRVIFVLLLFLYHDVVNLRSQATAIFHSDYKIT